jgi:NADH:ubiquinone oxidoreductase subunit C
LTAAQQALAAALPQAVVDRTADGTTVLRVALAELVATLTTLRDQLDYAAFRDLTAVDDPGRSDRFALTYLLYSMSRKAWVRVTARAGEEAPSVCGVFEAADWYERELFDLFGVRFTGHPDLTRLMMPDDWVGHPLRRDAPLGDEPIDFTVTRYPQEG